MSLTIITPRHKEHHVAWSHSFKLIGDPESGYSFDCNEEGALIQDERYAQVVERYLECSALVADGILFYNGIERREWDSIQHAIGKCQCGREVHLYHALNNECDCGRWYNLVGQEVIPWHGPSEDTGETMTEAEMNWDPEDVGFDSDGSAW